MSDLTDKDLLSQIGTELAVLPSQWDEVIACVRPDDKSKAILNTFELRLSQLVTDAREMMTRFGRLKSAITITTAMVTVRNEENDHLRALNAELYEVLDKIGSAIAFEYEARDEARAILTKAKATAEASGETGE
jgi:hypothetical protein